MGIVIEHVNCLGKNLSEFQCKVSTKSNKFCAVQRSAVHCFNIQQQTVWVFYLTILFASLIFVDWHKFTQIHAHINCNIDRFWAGSMDILLRLIWIAKDKWLRFTQQNRTNHLNMANWTLLLNEGNWIRFDTQKCEIFFCRNLHSFFLSVDDIIKECVNQKRVYNEEAA